jgi:hypothetical protein
MKMIGLTVPDFILLGEVGENQTKMSLFFRQYREFAVDS